MSVFVNRTGIGKNTVKIVVPVAVFLILAVVILGIWHAEEMRTIVSNQFNDEQLVIARNVAVLLERELGFLKKEITLISREIAPTPFDPEIVQTGMQKSLSRVISSGVRKVQVVDVAGKQAWHYILQGPWIYKNLNAEVAAVLPQYQDLPGEGVWVSEPLINPAQITLFMAVALPRPHSGMVVFEINVAWLLNPFVKDIRSGRTGYAWIICEKGFFLYHPKNEFIGKDAFNIRHEEDPRISFHIINFIQQEKMLKGLEGQGFYESGWHRGFTGLIKKLIAYTPIQISENPRQNWSIAIVAPISEIEDMIRRAYNRQLLMQIIILLVIGLSAGTVLLSERRWSRFLETKVAQRTEELQRSEEKYRSLIESAEDFIFTVDRQGCFLSMNSFTAGFFRETSSDEAARSIAELFPTDVARQQRQLIDQVFRQQSSVRDIYEIKLPGRRIWINANFMPIKNDRNKVVAVLCIARDITENKHLESQLSNAEKLASLGTLAAGVAHEINNPLGVMLGFCDLLLRKAEPGSQAWEDLKTIERQGLHCKEIVENLLSFARVGKETSQSTDLNECIGEVVKVVKHTLEMNDIELLLDLADNLPAVKGDFHQLQQVFLNLINNAVAAMPGGGALRLRTWFETDTQQISAQVGDTGTGISEDILDHIYEPFYTTKPEGEGTGLGLFVSYGIISRYGGTIACASHTSIGNSTEPRGTTFTMQLRQAQEV